MIKGKVIQPPFLDLLELDLDSGSCLSAEFSAFLLSMVLGKRWKRVPESFPESLLQLYSSQGHFKITCMLEIVSDDCIFSLVLQVSS